MLIQIVVAAVAVFLVLNERLYIHVATSGNGLVRVMDLFIPLLAFILVMFSRKSIMPWFRRGNIPCCMPYLLMGLCLPFLGVVGGDYPWRTLFTAIIGLRALGMIVIGIWLAQQPQRSRILLGRWMVFCIAFEALIAVGQFINSQHLFDAPLLEQLNQWDVQSMTDYNTAYLVTARSSGTFLGGNTLGVWSVLALWFSVTEVAGLTGSICMMASLLTLILSQSRGSIAALLAGVVLTAVFLPWVRRRTLFSLGGAIVTSVIVGQLFVGSLFNSTLETEQMQDRLSSGAAVISQGASADNNAQTRVDAWVDSMAFFAEHPLGTGGEPQYLVKLIDNQYVSTLLQGSIPYILALAWALYAGLRMPNNRSMRAFLALSTVSIAVNGISASPFQYPAIGIFWLAIGYSTLPAAARTVVAVAVPKTTVAIGRHSRLQPQV